MTREDGERALLEFAGFMKESTVYVVGSQAIYGSFPDLDLGIVLASKDIDVFTIPYYEGWWLPIVERFGSDSDFDLERGYYVDMVKPDLPRLPNGWKERAVRRTIVTIDIDGRATEVVAVFPEAHDLANSNATPSRPGHRFGKTSSSTCRCEPSGSALSSVMAISIVGPG